MSLSARSPILEPQETELTIRNLFRVGDSEDSDHLQDLVGNDKKKEAVVYILIGLLGALSAMAFYLLWLKVGD